MFSALSSGIVPVYATIIWKKFKLKILNPAETDLRPVVKEKHTPGLYILLDILDAVHTPDRTAQLIEKVIQLIQLYFCTVFSTMLHIFKTSTDYVWVQTLHARAHPMHLHSVKKTQNKSIASTMPSSRWWDAIFLGCIRPSSSSFQHEQRNALITLQSCIVCVTVVFFLNGSFTSSRFPPTVLLSVCPPRGAIPLDNRDNSFSRSRSSSVTSIDKEAREAITSFYFSQTYTRKMDSSLSPALWVGTSLGTVLAISLNMPPPGEQRLLQPVIVSPSGMLVVFLFVKFLGLLQSIHS